MKILIIIIFFANFFSAKLESFSQENSLNIEVSEKQNEDIFRNFGINEMSNNVIYLSIKKQENQNIVQSKSTEEQIIKDAIQTQVKEEIEQIIDDNFMRAKKIPWPIIGLISLIIICSTVLMYKVISVILPKKQNLNQSWDILGITTNIFPLVFEGITVYLIVVITATLSLSGTIQP